jgi:hypothetical protein
VEVLSTHLDSSEDDESLRSDYSLVKLFLILTPVTPRSKASGAHGHFVVVLVNMTFEASEANAVGCLEGDQGQDEVELFGRVSELKPAMETENYEWKLVSSVVNNYFYIIDN